MNQIIYDRNKHEEKKLDSSKYHQRFMMILRALQWYRIVQNQKLVLVKRKVKTHSQPINNNVNSAERPLIISSEKYQKRREKEINSEINCIIAISPEQSQ